MHARGGGGGGSGSGSGGGGGGGGGRRSIGNDGGGGGRSSAPGRLSAHGKSRVASLFDLLQELSVPPKPKR